MGVLSWTRQRYRHGNWVMVLVRWRLPSEMIQELSRTGWQDCTRKLFSRGNKKAWGGRGRSQLVSDSLKKNRQFSNPYYFLKPHSRACLRTKGRRSCCIEEQSWIQGWRLLAIWAFLISVVTPKCWDPWTYGPFFVGSKETDLLPTLFIFPMNVKFSSQTQGLV